MHASFDLSHVDFRTTPFENIFLDTYVAHAPETALRVYLMGWKACSDAHATGVNGADLAEALQLSPDALDEALSYWEGEGLVVRDADGTVFFRSMLLLWAGVGDAAKSSRSNAEAPHSAEGEAMPSRGVAPATNDVVYAAPGAERRASADEGTPDEGMTRTQMFDALEDFLSRGFQYRVLLKDNELRLILDVMNTYAFTPEYFLYAYQKAAVNSESTARSVKYLTTIVENWARFDGITTKDALDRYLDQKAKKKSIKRGKRRREKNVDEDTRLSKDEQREWVKKKLEASRLRDLRGGKP